MEPDKEGGGQPNTDTSQAREATDQADGEMSENTAHISTESALEHILEEMQSSWHEGALRDILIAPARDTNPNTNFRGHDMEKRLDSSGCRIITMNVQRKLLNTEDKIPGKDGQPDRPPSKNWRGLRVDAHAAASQQRATTTHLID